MKQSSLFIKLYLGKYLAETHLSDEEYLSEVGKKSREVVMALSPFVIDNVAFQFDILREGGLYGELKGANVLPVIVEGRHTPNGFVGELFDLTVDLSYSKKPSQNTSLSDLVHRP